ncbi:MAG TPA: hypothetical protein VNF73_16475 [Candidatus Saccharimonadales bacterium]|nr:hypothetical protein [Candidatus Saccharimonadales bacterium]
MSGARYWVGVALLAAFGFVTGFSIGAPFLLLAIVLAVVGPFRGHARIFWPAVASVVGLTIGYVLFAPLVCTATEAVGAASAVVCSSILGGPYSGAGTYNPPLEPALRAAVVSAMLAAGATFAVLTLRRRSRP